jgi:hypothetical protein
LAIRIKRKCLNALAEWISGSQGTFKRNLDSLLRDFEVRSLQALQWLVRFVITVVYLVISKHNVSNEDEIRARTEGVTLMGRPLLLRQLV